MRLLNDVHKDTLHKLTVLVVLLLFVSFLIPIGQSPVNLYASFTDDFYYYLKIAQSFTRGDGLSYTSHIYTNGYQPFFQFFIVLLVYIAHLIGAPELVFIRFVMALVFMIASLVLLRQLRPRGYAATFFFLLGLFGYYIISYSGMESLFIVPVLTYFVFKLSTGSISVNRAALLVALAFFIRIDSFVITLPLFFYYFSQHIPRRGRSAMLAPFVIMGLPVALYLGVNYFLYHSSFPVSGLAKTVVKLGGVNGASLKSFAFYFPYNVYNVAVTGLFILVALTGDFKAKRYFHLLALVTLLFYILTAVRSDWALWAWYFYPVPPLAFMLSAQGGALFSAPNPRLAGLNRFIYAAAAFAAVVVLFSFVIWAFYSLPLYKTSSEGEGKVDILHIGGLHIKEFEEHHKGVYAMGDRAGIVGYLIKSPLIQLEGLVMDKEYMNRLSKTEKLYDLLHAYNVNYYIASNPTRLDDSTYVVKEPAQSHGLSHQITDTIHWKICDSLTLSSKGVFTRKENDRFQTVIFEVPR
ncbi:MAG TPA: hypothetical protein VGM41_15790 [Chitinophagaceae bacterium]